MTHTCLKSPFLPLSEYTTIGGGEVTACKSYEQKTAKMAQKPGFALRWYQPNGSERYACNPNHWCRSSAPSQPFLDVAKLLPTAEPSPPPYTRHLLEMPPYTPTPLCHPNPTPGRMGGGVEGQRGFSWTRGPYHPDPNVHGGGSSFGRQAPNGPRSEGPRG